MPLAEIIELLDYDLANGLRLALFAVWRWLGCRSPRLESHGRSEDVLFLFDSVRQDLNE